MRVLMLNTEKGWRGGERQTLFSLTGLREVGVRAELLCRSGAPMEEKARAAGVAVYGAPDHLTASAFLALHGRRFDILHAQTGRTHSAAVLTRPFHQRPIVYTRRVDFPPKNGFSTWKYHQTNAVVAISHAIREILENAGITVAEVIPSAVQPRRLHEERAQQLRHKLTDRRTRYLIGAIAALVPHKDPLTMVKAVESLAQRRKDFRFVHFGEGPLRQDMERAIKARKLEDVYRLQGHVEHVEDFYAALDLFAMSSREEGLGSAVLDAFLYGVPVVATSAGGLRETVEGRGLLAAPGDPEALANLMHDVLENPLRARERARKARREVRRHYSVKPMATAYADLYRSLHA